MLILQGGFHSFGGTILQIPYLSASSRILQNPIRKKERERKRLSEIDRGRERERVRGRKRERKDERERERWSKREIERE